MISQKTPVLPPEKAEIQVENFLEFMVGNFFNKNATIGSYGLKTGRVIGPLRGPLWKSGNQRVAQLHGVINTKLLI